MNEKQQPHRGRFQAQGRNLEKSAKWEQHTPPSVTQGHQLLGELRNMLTARELSDRLEAFAQAGLAVDRAGREGGLPTDNRYPSGKSYPQPPRRDGKRVDLEIWAGKAFVPDQV